MVAERGHVTYHPVPQLPPEKTLEEQGFGPELGNATVHLVMSPSTQAGATHGVRIVDTNGAGDAFVGGFLAAFSRGRSLSDCCEDWG